MFKRFMLVMVIAAGICVVVSSPLPAQSKEDAIRLHKEAYALQAKAQSLVDMKRAEEKFLQAIAIYHRVGDRKNAGLACNSVGLIYASWGQYDKAVEYYEKSLAVRRELKDRKGEGQSLNNLGIVYENWGQYDKAVDHYEKSLAIARELKDRKGEVNPLTNLGNVYKDWGQYDKAVDHYEKSLAIARELKDRKGQVSPLNNLGIVYKDWGQYDKAVDYYEKSLSIARELKDLKGEAQSLGNLGNVFSRWGQYDKAVDYYEKSLSIARELKDLKGEGSSLNNLGVVYKDWGQYDKAVEYYKKSLAIKRELKDRKGEGLTLMNIGRVLQHGEEHRKALESFHKGLAIWTEIKVPTRGPKALIADTYMDIGDLPRAEPLLKEANSNSHWGRFCLLKSDHTKAKEYYGRILKSAEQSRNADNLFTAYTGLGAACEGLKDDAGAAENYRKAVGQTEDLRSSLSAAERESFFDVKINGFYRTAPYEGLARVMIKMNRPTDAFKESEYTRARIFAEAISKRSEYAGLDVPKDVREKDSQLTDQLSALTKNLQQAYEKGNKQVISVLDPQVKDAKKSLAAHIDVLRKQYPLYAATRYPQPMDLERTSLGAAEWVLAYHVTDQGLIVYVTKGKQLVKALFKPVQRKEIDSLVRKFREPLEMNPKEGPQGFIEKLNKFDFSTGKQLTDVLLADVLSVLPKDTPIIVVPDGSLGVLPFEALPLNSSGRIAGDKKIPYVTGAEFFGDRNPLCYGQSVTALTLARTLGKQKKPVERLLVLADPVFQMKEARAQQGSRQTVKAAGAQARLYKNLMAAMEEGELGNLRFNRLPLAGELAEDLKGSYRGNSDVHTGFDASKERFLGKLAPKLDGYDKIVFATHGYFGRDLPGIKEPVLVLTLVPPGTDGFLRMSEVAGLKMNADVVALTACQSGLGRNISGEGTMGMGRAFQYAGARSVLMSLWSVAEKSSVQMVESFFKHMKDGKNKLEAMKLARDEIRKAGYDHPFFWAPFILVGEID